MSWHPAPDRAPHRCFVTRQGVEDQGPYCDLRLDYFRPVKREDGKVGVEPRLQRLYLSARGIKTLCDEPGSPLVAVDREEFAAVKEHNGVLLAELTAANDRVAELEAELEAREQPIIDGNAMARMLEAMDARYTRKRRAKA